MTDRNVTFCRLVSLAENLHHSQYGRKHSSQMNRLLTKASIRPLASELILEGWRHRSVAHDSEEKLL
jgi:hypothetical protein